MWIIALIREILVLIGVWHLKHKIFLIIKFEYSERGKCK